MPADRYWYEFVVLPIVNLPPVCEAAEGQGWEIVSIFPTLEMARLSGIVSAKGQAVAPMVALVARTPRLPDQERPAYGMLRVMLQGLDNGTGPTLN